MIATSPRNAPREAVLSLSASNAKAEPMMTDLAPALKNARANQRRVFASAALTAGRGDLCALVTDGLTEVFNAHDRELGLEPLKHVIQEHAARPLSEIADRIVDLSRDYGAQQDDQTLLLIRV